MTSKEALEVIANHCKEIFTIYLGCASNLYTALGIEFMIIKDDLILLEKLKEAQNGD